MRARATKTCGQHVGSLAELRVMIKQFPSFPKQKPSNQELMVIKILASETGSEENDTKDWCLTSTNFSKSGYLWPQATFLNV